MRPITLHGHTRPLTQVKYNREGDLLFSASKDFVPNVYYSHNGERLGSFHGHRGAVRSISISSNSERLLTGAADNLSIIFQVETGKLLAKFECLSPVVAVSFSMGDKEAFVLTENVMSENSILHVFDVTKDSFELKYKKIIETNSKPTNAIYGYLNKTIIITFEDGSIALYDAKTLEKIAETKDHEKAITDIEMSKDYTHFITSSKDATARVYDPRNLTLIKTLQADRPLNSVSLSAMRPEVILGGGQEASEVTTSDAKAGKFDVLFFHKIYEDELGKIGGHFGPVNTLRYHPNGIGFTSGSEDGTVKIHHFDPDYFSFAYPDQ
ncbi:eukaryotic translation initiation factor 3 subunit [Rozella allomycis CSF55]|uniref:Eukaryotic translation initiation factor 3 subunit I n=1 Tax=Rozella allomycis (strain CSF55) TaxID=988480 RepID=A0A075AYI8_ROZAC|nr:hypothetical protein O9G_004435 [Rozella allomycis CSF55]RKP18342.1 eukaryotic translation initiation factor 3 subunit [Rozella allomycis CSF55]|eukprot:EPZ33787.1 hypothetical protein O9G_004435 [Rozella allomycis CSF55]